MALFESVVDGFLAIPINEARSIGAWQRGHLREMLIDFYEGNQHGKDEYLKQFGFNNRDSLPFYSEPLTSRVIQEISLVYDIPPNRYVLDRNGNQVRKHPFYDFIEQYPFFDFAMQTVEYYFNLLDNVLFRIAFDQDAQRLRFYIESDYIPHFRDGNPLYPVAYSILVKENYDEKVSKYEPVYLYMDAQQFFYHDAYGRKLNGPQYPSGDHDYGLIPVVDYSIFPVSEYWGIGRKSLVEANRMLNILELTRFYGIQYQSFDQLYAIGMSIDDAGQLRVGPDEIMVNENSEGKFGRIGFSPQILETETAMERWLTRILDHYGVTATFREEGNVFSGVALRIKRQRLTRKHRKDVVYHREKENQIFRLITAMIRVHSELGIKSWGDDDFRLVTQFSKPQFPVSFVEERDEWEWKVSRNIKTWADYLMEENHSLTFEQALEMLEKNRGVNKTFDDSSPVSEGG